MDSGNFEGAAAGILQRDIYGSLVLTLDNWEPGRITSAGSSPSLFRVGNNRILFKELER
jgi:hypothetical protein